MSGNTSAKPTQPPPAKPDRRILRTRDSLGDALIDLMQQMPFDDITVQQVLDRAGVSRSTFYTHYRDKDDLFLSDVEDFFTMMGDFLTRRGAPPTRIAPVEEFFAHVADVPGVSDAINASGKGADVRELGIGCFARSIEQRLTLAGIVLPAAELKATSCALAGALFSLLDWWIRQGKSMPPKDADALFHRLAWSSLPAAARAKI
jgi:AcrR family transcriptional regulator